jgi:hypothetical protein
LFEEQSNISINDLRVILLGIFGIFDSKVLKDIELSLPKQTADNSFQYKIVKSFGLPTK